MSSKLIAARATAVRLLLHSCSIDRVRSLACSDSVRTLIVRISNVNKFKLFDEIERGGIYLRNDVRYIDR